jgi:hypothetical protein
MITEVNEAKKWFQKKFDDLSGVPPGDYAIPTRTSKGPAFMRVTIDKNKGMSNFDLWWDEEMTKSWYTEPKP